MYKSEIAKEIISQSYNVTDQAGNELQIVDTKEVLDIVNRLVDSDSISNVMAVLPTESQLDEIAFKKYGNDPDGAIKFNLVKRMAFIEGCEFMLRLINSN